VRGAEASCVDKVGEGPSLHQAIEGGGAFGVVVEVVEVHFEEVDFFFYLFEDDLVVPVAACLFEDSRKEELIEAANLIDVHEDGLRFLAADDLFVEEGRLEIGDDDAEVPDVVLLSIQQLLDDHFAREKVLYCLLYTLSGLHSSETGLDYCGGSFCRQPIPFLHIQLLSSFPIKNTKHSSTINCATTQQTIISYQLSGDGKLIL
jgi:hypothetical protein